MYLLMCTIIASGLMMAAEPVMGAEVQVVAGKLGGANVQEITGKLDDSGTETKEPPNDILELKDDPAADEPNYLIKVNRATNYTVVYAEDSDGEFTIPVIKFANSTGKGNGTPTGEYTIFKKHRWQPMNHGVYTQYAVRFMEHIMFHSPYYLKKNNSTLNAEQYNLLGQQASAGCVREATVDSKWLYEHCKLGTKVIVYDDAKDIGPLGEPRTVTIPLDSPYAGWDPTDPDTNNPWAEVRPVLRLKTTFQFGKSEMSFVRDDNVIMLSSGSTKGQLWSTIKLFTPEGVEYEAQDYTLEIYGTYDLSKRGDYTLYVRGFDLETTLRADATFVLKVR